MKFGEKETLYLIVFLLLSLMVVGFVGVYFEHKYNGLVVDYNDCMRNLSTSIQIDGGNFNKNGFNFETTS